GLSRQASLRRLLGSADVSKERFEELADRKNGYYQECLKSLTEDGVLPGVRHLLDGLAEMGLKLAVVSLSCNARTVLLRTGVMDAFDIIIDGRDLVRVRSSLNRYLRAAGILGVEPGRCVVVEDSTAGIAASRTAGMRSVGVGDPDRLCAATLAFESLRGVQAATLVQWLAEGRP
ncbi:MAG: HAD-IA family hydrolase, partial [Dehalococcoidia bacterium]